MTEKENKPSILFVEDDATLLHMLEFTLNLFGYHVIPANSSADGLKIFKAQSEKIDLVITARSVAG